MSVLTLLGLPGRAHCTQPEWPSLAVEEPAAIASVLENEGSLTALSRAMLLRLAVSQPAKVAADMDRFLAALARLSASSSLVPADCAAAENFFEDVLDVTKWPDTAIWQGAMRRFIGALTGRQLSTLRFRAEVALAAQLWQQSCPISGDDGACVKRLNAAALCINAQNTAAATLRRNHPDRHVRINDQLDSPNFAYKVYPRSVLLAQEAQRLLNAALNHMDSAQLQSAQPGDALDEAVAHVVSRPHSRLEPQL